MLRPLFGLALWMRTFNMSAIYEGTQFTSWKPTRRSSVRAGTASEVANRPHPMLTVAIALQPDVLGESRRRFSHAESGHNSPPLKYLAEIGDSTPRYSF